MWWTDLTFLHWPYDPAEVQALLPDGIEVDVWPDADGRPRAWVALVPFEMQVGTPGGLKLPVVGRFPETNIRTYVRGPDGTTGVWFCSLEAGGLAATVAARTTYGLPYFWADMSIDPGDRAEGGVWEYRTTRRWPGPRGASSAARVRVGAAIDDADVSDFEHFLTARWGLFSRFPSMRAGRGWNVYAPVDHGRWGLHRCEVLDLDDGLIAAAGLPAPTGDPIAHWTPGTEVRIGRPRVVRTGS